MPAKKSAPVVSKASKTAPAAKGKGAIQKNPLLERRPRNFGIGQDLQPKRNLGRYVKFPTYVEVQRKKKILFQRLKLPPTINQFTKTVDKATATQLLKLLTKYRPETKQAKTQRLRTAAQSQAKGETAEQKKPVVLKYGINTITKLVEQKKAKLVVIAHDVDPIELVVWLPALCRKQGVPYCIIKSKSRLGSLVHKKIVTAVALVDVGKEDKNELAQLAGLFTESYNKNTEMRRQWGGGRLGMKAVHAIRKRERAVARERISKKE
jgi:large subunit ribosomal protein L7Ae